MAGPRPRDDWPAEEDEMCTAISVKVGSPWRAGELGPPSGDPSRLITSGLISLTRLALVGSISVDRSTCEDWTSGMGEAGSLGPRSACLGSGVSLGTN